MVWFGLISMAFYSQTMSIMSASNLQRAVCPSAILPEHSPFLPKVERRSVHLEGAPSRTRAGAGPLRPLGCMKELKPCWLKTTQHVWVKPLLRYGKLMPRHGINDADLFLRGNNSTFDKSLSDWLIPGRGIIRGHVIMSSTGAARGGQKLCAGQMRTARGAFSSSSGDVFFLKKEKT